MRRWTRASGASALALVALLVAAVPAFADSEFDPGYQQVTRWQELVPPPPLAALPATPSDEGACATASADADTARYCKLSWHCWEPVAGELLAWCQVLGTVIEDRPSLKSCARDAGAAGCADLRTQLAARCGTAPSGPGASTDAYLCASFTAAFPDATRGSPGAPAPPTQPAQPPPGAAPVDPAQPGAPGTDPDSDYDGQGDADLMSGNGGTSPACKRTDLPPDLRANCDRSRSIVRPYPFSSYGIDNHVDWGVTKLGNVPALMIQWILVGIWQILLVAVNGTLLLLEWAFALDLVGTEMSGISRALLRLHDDVLGTSWTLAAISIAGLWGIWNGIVRQRTIQTLASLGVAVLMMCAALVVINQPRPTIGSASKVINDGSVEVLTIVATGTAESGPNAFGGAEAKLFNTVVRSGWCAMQFGSVSFCDQHRAEVCQSIGWIRRCQSFDGTNADAWLQYAANSGERRGLYEWQKSIDENTTRMQDVSGATSRIGLLALLAVGQIGTSVLFLYLGLNLLRAAIETLLYLLALAPMLAAPAFGEAGRNAFLTLCKRLLGAIATKAVFALFLAVVLLVLNLIASIDGIGWYARWEIFAATPWIAFLSRDKLIGLVLPEGASSSGGLSSIFYGMQMARSAMRMATAPVRRAARVGRWATRRTSGKLATRRHMGDDALRGDAQGQLEERGESEVRDHKREQLKHAQAIVREAADARKQLPEVRSKLRQTGAELAKARGERDKYAHAHEALRSLPDSDPRRVASKQQLDDATAKVDALENRRGQLAGEQSRLEREVDGPELEAARAVVRRSAGGVQVSGADVRDWIETRQRELSSPGAPTDAAADRDRELLARASGHSFSRRERRKAKRDVKGDFDRTQTVKQDAKALRKDDKRQGRYERRRARIGRR